MNTATMVSVTLRDADGTPCSIACAARTVWLDDGRNAADALKDADAAMQRLDTSIARLATAIDILVAKTLPE